MTDRQVIHRLPAGQGPQVNAALAQLFGVALLDALGQALQERREALATGVAPERKEAGGAAPVSRI